MNLYEISEEYMNFLSSVEMGDIPPEAVMDTLEAIIGEFDQKVDNLACLVKSLDAESIAIKAEESALKSRRSMKENTAAKVKQYLSDAMLKTGKTKIETARNALSFRKSTSLYISDEQSFKDDYRDFCKIEEVVSIPKSDITKLIKSGQEFAGAVLIENQNLQIK